MLLTERKAFIKKFAAAFNLLKSGKEREYHEAMRGLSTEIFNKYGTAEHKGNMELEVAEAGANLLQQKIETLNTKYPKLNNGIRSFAAGLTVGTVGTTAFFGLESVFERILKGEIRLPFFGGEAQRGTPTPGIGHPTPGVEHPVPGIEHPTPTPTPEPVEKPGGAIPPVEHAPTLPEIISNPDLAHSVEIHPGDTIGPILVATDHHVTWGFDNAELFGAHINANYDMLHAMHERAAAAGIAVEKFPAREELAGLIRSATGGDATAMHQLTEALHWVPPAGENLNILTPEGVEASLTDMGVT